VTNLTNIGPGGPVSLQRPDESPAPGGVAASTLAQAAGRLGQTIASALGLPGADQTGPWQGGSTHDGYGLDELADALSQQLGGGPADRGALARALHDFATEAASLLAARPQSVSFETIAAVIGASSDPQSGSGIRDAIAVIERATSDLKGR
jgi:hypothetical protein